MAKIRGTTCFIGGLLVTATMATASGLPQRHAFPGPSAASQPSAATTPTLGVCDSKTPKAPCIKQPTEGSPQVTGQGTKGDSVTAKITRAGGKQEVAGPVTVGDDGAFTIPLASPFQESDVVEVDETSAPVTGAAVSVEPVTPITCEAPYPCIQQPYVGDTQVSGKAKLTGGKVPKGATVSITILKRTGATESCTPKPDGTFTIAVSPALNQGEILEAHQSDPQDGEPVGVKVRPTASCDAQLPCVAQPHVGDTKVAGKAKPDSATGKVAEGTRVSITIDGKPAGSPVSVKDDGTFVIYLDSPLERPKPSQAPQIVQASQTGPTISGNPIAIQKEPSRICSPTSSELPCLDPLYANTQAITGHAAKGSDVTVSINDGKPTYVYNDDGEFKLPLKGSLSQYDKVRADQKNPDGTTATTGTIHVGAPKPNPNSGQSLYSLMLGGVDVTSTSSSGPKGQYSVDVRLSAPLGSGSDPLEAPLWVWLNPRVASLPTSQTANISSLASSTTAFSSSGVPTTLGAITQSLEFHGGLEVAILKPRKEVLFTGILGNQTIGISLIGGLGAVSPFNSAAGAQEYNLGTLNTGKQTGTANVTNLLQQFSNTPQLQSQYPQLYNTLSTNCPNSGSSPTPAAACSYEYVGFVLPNRSRFERSWALGMRVKSFYFASGCTQASIDPKDVSLRCQPEGTFPGTLDVTLGQDESVTAGRLYGFVLTVSASYPIPGLAWARVFGSAYLGLSKNENSPVLPLDPVSSFIDLSNTSLILQPVMPQNQDYFRLGFGVDIAQLINSKKKKISDKTSSSGGSTGSQ